MNNCSHKLLKLAHCHVPISHGGILNRVCLKEKVKSMGLKLMGGLPIRESKVNLSGQKSSPHSRMTNRSFIDSIPNQKAATFWKIFTCHPPAMETCRDYDQMYEQLVSCFDRPTSAGKRKPRLPRKHKHGVSMIGIGDGIPTSRASANVGVPRRVSLNRHSRYASHKRNNQKLQGPESSNMIVKHYKVGKTANSNSSVKQTSDSSKAKSLRFYSSSEDLKDSKKHYTFFPYKMDPVGPTNKSFRIYKVPSAHNLNKRNQEKSIPLSKSIFNIYENLENYTEDNPHSTELSSVSRNSLTLRRTNRMRSILGTSLDPQRIQKIRNFLMESNSNNNSDTTNKNRESVNTSKHMLRSRSTLHPCLSETDLVTEPSTPHGAKSKKSTHGANHGAKHEAKHEEMHETMPEAIPTAETRRNTMESEKTEKMISVIHPTQLSMHNVKISSTTISVSELPEEHEAISSISKRSSVSSQTDESAVHFGKLSPDVVEPEATPNPPASRFRTKRRRDTIISLNNSRSISSMYTSDRKSLRRMTSSKSSRTGKSMMSIGKRNRIKREYRSPFMKSFIETRSLDNHKRFNKDQIRATLVSQHRQNGKNKITEVPNRRTKPLKSDDSITQSLTSIGNLTPNGSIGNIGDLASRLYATIDVAQYIKNFMTRKNLTLDMLQDFPKSWPHTCDSGIVSVLRQAERKIKQQNALALEQAKKRRRRRKRRMPATLEEAVNWEKSAGCMICRNIHRTLPDQPYMREMTQQREREELKRYYHYHVLPTVSQEQDAEELDVEEPELRVQQKRLRDKLIKCYATLRDCQTRLDIKLKQLQLDDRCL